MLLQIEGLAVSRKQANKIKQLFDQLIDYDKRPLTFEPLARKGGKGSRFARTKDSRSGHVGETAMKR